MEQTFPLYHGIIFPIEYVFVGNVYHHQFCCVNLLPQPPKKMSLF